MGTNYFIRTPPSCGGKCAHHCPGEEEIHLGKSSAGWAFTFRGYPEPAEASSLVTWPVTDFGSWRRLLDLGPVYDEYGQEVTPAELLERIESKRGGVNDTYPELRDYLDEAGNRFVPREFS